jgi:hypothetical protein
MQVAIPGRTGVGNARQRWGNERRLEFIEFRLFWEAHVSRSDLMAAFGIAINQVGRPQPLPPHGPDNVVYDKSARAYVQCGGWCLRPAGRSAKK